jgi:hypothetical protein
MTPLCSCNSTTYSTDGYLSNCEVGDISGKFGAMKTQSGSLSTNLTFVGSITDDPMGPIDANYLATESYGLKSLSWGSIVFHCPASGNPAMLCAKFNAVPVSGPTAAPVSSPVQTNLIVPSVSKGFNSTINTNGAYGYFSMEIAGDGSANYKWDINLRNLTTLSAADILLIQTSGLKCTFYSSIFVIVICRVQTTFTLPGVSLTSRVKPCATRPQLADTTIHTWRAVRRVL